MSNNSIITIRKFEVEDFISIDHGTKAVTLTIFRGNDVSHVGAPGRIDTIELPPDQAEALGKELINRSKMVRQYQ